MYTKLTWFLLSCCCLSQVSHANVIFHFSLDFGTQSNPLLPSVNHTIIMDRNELSLQSTNNVVEQSTAAPDAVEANFNETAMQKLIETKLAVQKLNAELTPLVGRSDDLAARLKQSLHYANKVDTQLESDSASLADHIELLRSYVTLVDTLQAASNAGGTRTLEYVLMKLAIEKHALLRLQQQVNEYLQQAEANWKNYNATRVIVSETANT